jgi:hypothetical protein
MAKAAGHARCPAWRGLPYSRGRMFYWFVVAGALVAAVFVLVLGAFVLPAVVFWFSFPHPVSTAPAKSPASTKRIYILFIVEVILSITAHKTSRNFAQGFAAGLGEPFRTDQRPSGEPEAAAT